MKTGVKDVQCPLDFSKLSIGALRKYQYKFKLGSGPDDKSLLRRTDLIKAVERHYMLQFSVDEVSLIGRFLRLEKQDKIDSYGCTTRQSRPTGRNNGALALNALGPSTPSGAQASKEAKGLSSAIVTNSTASS